MLAEYMFHQLSRHLQLFS